VIDFDFERSPFEPIDHLQPGKPPVFHRRKPASTTPASPRAQFPRAGTELREQTKRWYDHQTGEIYLSDAINAYAHGRAVYGQVIHGDWYDIGNPSDYLVAQFASALAHPLYGPALRRLAHEIERADADPIGE
jgi:hypothetical protein